MHFQKVPSATLLPVEASVCAPPAIAQASAQVVSGQVSSVEGWVAAGADAAGPPWFAPGWEGTMEAGTLQRHSRSGPVGPEPFGRTVRMAVADVMETLSYRQLGNRDMSQEAQKEGRCQD